MCVQRLKFFTTPLISRNDYGKATSTDLGVAHRFYQEGKFSEFANAASMNNEHQLFTYFEINTRSFINSSPSSGDFDNNNPLKLNQQNFHKTKKLSILMVLL